MIIVRPAEIKKIKKGNWLLVYGRRKTGKTYLVENFTKFDGFFFIKRDRTILNKQEWQEYSYETFKEILRRDLASGKCIVVDEFHRLGEDFRDYLHALPQKGKLILISSTLHMANKLIGTSSPLLGKFGEIKIGLIELRDILRSIKIKIKDKKKKLELVALLREPILVNLVNNDPMDIAEVIMKLRFTSSALLGEIFTEEDRTLSCIYEGVIRAIAVGKVNSGEICSFLFSKKLIQKDDPSIIQQYLINLVDFGIIEKIPVWNKNRMVYRHISPILRIFFYLDERYNFGDRDITKSELNTFLKEILPKVMEDSIRVLLGQTLGLNIFHYQTKDLELDGFYTKFKKPKAALEVKWKSRLKPEDLKKAEDNLEKVNVAKRILFVPDKEGLVSDKIDIMDISDIEL
jgi:hypothetical protein